MDVLRRTRRALVSRAPLPLVLMWLAAMTACAGLEPFVDRSASDTMTPVQTVSITDGVVSPNELWLPAGEEVTIEVVNRDLTAHDVRVASFDVRTGPIEPGRAARMTFIVPGTSTLFACAYHSSVVGTVIGT